MSNKYLQYKDEGIFPHKHCPACTKMIPEDEEYCSAECAGHSKTKEKGQKKKIFGFVIVYVIAITIFIVIAFL